jgi:hypothetical protein
MTDDDPRLLPADIEKRLVDDILDGRLTPRQVTAKRNRMLERKYGPRPAPRPAPRGRPSKSAPKMPVRCPHCVKGLINGGTEGCGHCGGEGWVYVPMQ